MFVIAIIDERSVLKLILANDSSSIKSLYYYWNKFTDTIYFSSELKSLFAFNIPKELRLEAVDEYMTGRAILHNKTFFKDIYTLAPATILTKFEKCTPNIAQYISILSNFWDPSCGFEMAAYYLNDLLEKEMKKIVQCDVPICVVTSGGIDSSYITAIAANHIDNLHCFNIAYEGDWPADERVFAKEVSNHYGAKYHQVVIKECEFTNVLEKTILHLGQPNAAPHALSTYALFQAIHQAGFKVVITGEGADEYFAGYDRFKKSIFNQNQKWINDYLDNLCATTQRMRNSIYTEAYKIYLNNQKHHYLAHLEETILVQEKRLGRLKSLLHFEQSERFTSYILRRVDHLSMANSVEVRVPFCQPTISSFSKSLSDEYLLDQYSVKKIIYQAAHYKNLPSSILEMPKQPFTLPITAMLNKNFPLFDILQDTLKSQKFISRGIFNNKKVNSLIRNQLTFPNPDVANTLWAIMILELWLQHIDSNLSL